MALTLPEVRGVLAERTADNINDPIDNLNATVLHHLLRFPSNTSEDINKAVSFGADINQQDTNGETPLFWFARRKPRGSFNRLSINTLLDSIDPLIQAKHQGTLLHAAARNGDVDMCSYLIAKYPTMVGVRSEIKLQTALHVASNAQVATPLIQGLADRVFVLDHAGCSELFYAVKRHEAKLVEMFQKEFLAPPTDINNILSEVITLPDLPILKILLLYKPDITLELVTAAVLSNNSKILLKVLNHVSDSVLRENPSNVLSPYLAAMTVNDTHLFTLLTKKLAPSDWGLIVDKEGWNVAHYCIFFNRTSLLDNMMSDPQYSKLMKTPNKQGFYPLAYAVQQASSSSKSALQVLGPKIIELKHYKANATFDLLHFAIELQNYAAVESLVGMRFKFGKDGQGQSVFHRACWAYPEPRVIDLLVNTDKAQINKLDGTEDTPAEERLTPLEYTLLKQNEKLVEHLVTKHGVDVDMNKVEVILKYLCMYEVDGDEAEELAELVGYQGVDDIIDNKVAPKEVQHIKDIVERLNHSVQFSHPTPDYISTTADVKHYKPYNMIIVCSNSVGTPLTALDMLYEDDEEYLVKFHLLPIESFDVEDVEKFEKLPNIGLVVWFDVGMVEYLDSITDLLDIKSYTLLVKNYKRDWAAALKLESDLILNYGMYDEYREVSEQMEQIATDVISTRTGIFNPSDVLIRAPYSCLEHLSDNSFHQRDQNISEELISCGIIFSPKFNEAYVPYVSNFYGCKTSISTVQPTYHEPLEKLNLLYTSYDGTGEVVQYTNVVNTSVIRSKLSDSQVRSSLYVRVMKETTDVTPFTLQALYRRLHKTYLLLPCEGNQLQVTPSARIVLHNVDHHLLQVRLESDSETKGATPVITLLPYIEFIVRACITAIGMQCEVNMFAGYKEFVEQIVLPVEEKPQQQYSPDPGREHLTQLRLQQSFSKLERFLHNNPELRDNLARTMGIEQSCLHTEGSTQGLLRLHVTTCDPHIRLLLRQLDCTEGQKEDLLTTLGIDTQYGRSRLRNVWEVNKVEFILLVVAVVIVIILVVLVEALKVDAGKYGIAGVTSLSFILLVVKRCYYSFQRSDRSKYEPLEVEEEEAEEEV